jgi:hypothetical protein
MNDDPLEKLRKNPPDFMKFELGQTLEDVVHEWWMNTFTAQNDMSVSGSIHNLCERVENWLPVFQNASGTQRLETEIAVETHNQLLKKIVDKIYNENIR